MIYKKNLAHHDHIETIMRLEKMALQSFLFCSKGMIRDILDALREEKLTKSRKLPKGWVGKVNKVEVNLEKKLSPVLDKYFQALRYSLFGKLAGKEALEAAEQVGLKNKVVPGILISSYLDALDTERAHFGLTLDTAAPTLPPGTITDTLLQIKRTTQMFLDEMFLRIRNSMITGVQNSINDNNFNILNFVRKRTLNEIDINETPDAKAFREALQDAQYKDLKSSKVESGLKKVVKKLATDYDTSVSAFIGNSSGVATHQYLTEVVGSNGPVKAVLMTLKDPKVCDVCDDYSMKNGEYIVYDISDFKPAGFNFGKKKDDWRLSIPPIHHRCRCRIIYVPPGFQLSSNGNIFKYGEDL